VADLVTSSTEVAVTVPVPGVMAAVNAPYLSMLPADLLADQVTPCEEFVTVAVKCVRAPAFKTTAEGCTFTVIVPEGAGVGLGAFTVTLALADLVESCIDVAVTEPPPAPVAVNMPLALIVPSEDGETVQATPELEFVTVAVNCVVAPIFSVALAGLNPTVMAAGAVTSDPMRYVASSATALDECGTLLKPGVPSLPQ
jgi:hypothetical protein